MNWAMCRFETRRCWPCLELHTVRLWHLHGIVGRRCSGSRVFQGDISEMFDCARFRSSSVHSFCTFVCSCRQSMLSFLRYCMAPIGQLCLRDLQRLQLRPCYWWFFLHPSVLSSPMLNLGDLAQDICIWLYAPRHSNAWRTLNVHSREESSCLRWIKWY